MRFLKQFVFFIGAYVACYSAFAEGLTSSRQILSIGCHLNDTTCYVTVDGAAVGPSQCSGTSLRWNESTSPGGKNVLALLMGAHMSGKSVVFYVVDTCYNNGTFPTFSYIYVNAQ